MASVLDNMSVRQRALVSREVAREYGAWRKRYGEPSKRDRDIILARGFGAARKKDPRIPMPNGLSRLAAGAVGGAVGAVVAGALANPGKVPKCRRCGQKMSLMATVDKKRFWWECPKRHRAALNPSAGRSRKITRDDIVRAVSNLTHPATPEELKILVREHEGKYYKGHPYELQSMLVGSLLSLRGERGVGGGYTSNPLVELPAAPTTLGPAAAVPMVNPLIRGDKLTHFQRQQVLNAFGYRWTVENLDRAKQWLGESRWPRIKPQSDAQWLREHAFWFTKDGRLSAKRRHAVPSYVAGDPGYSSRHNPANPRARVYGQEAAFCGPNCESGFREDRRSGAIYPAVHEVDEAGRRTGRWWSHEQYSILSQTCAYCNAPVRLRRLARDPQPNPLLMTVMGANPNPLTTEEYEKIHYSASGNRRAAALLPRGGYSQGLLHGVAQGMERTANDYYGYGQSPQENPRAVHEDIVEAFFAHRPRSIGPRYRTDGRELRVWGNLVAEWRPEGLYVTDAGWRTLLTRNVLNQVLLEAFRRGYQGGVLYQKKFGWYFEPFGSDGRPIPSKKIEWKGGMVIGMASVSPVAVPAANPGGCPPMCLNPMHEHKGKKPRSAAEKARWRALKGKVSWLERTSVTKLRRDYERRHRGRTNPARRSKRITMTLAEFARRVKKTGDKRLWAAFLKKIEGYKKWTHGTLPKKVTVEMLDVPGVDGTWITYDAGREPEARYEMPKGSKRKGAWRHPWDTPPKISHDPEAGIVLKKLSGRSKITDFYHR